jgi:hypothetical protein
MNYLAACRMSDRCEEPFEGRTRLYQSALWWSAPAPTKGPPPFRKEMPEAFSSDALEFIHDRAAAPVA